MSMPRPLLRSPKFGEGMTSEAIEVSGVKIFMFAAVFGIGSERSRFESDPSEGSEPEDIVQFKPAGERRIKPREKVLTIYLRLAPVQSTARSDAPNFGGTCVV